MKVPTRLSVLILALALAACSQAPAPSAPKITGKVMGTSASSGPALGAAMFIISPDELGALDLAAVAPGMWVTPASPVGPGGSIEIPFPTVEQVPASLLVGADEMLYLGTTKCPLTGASAAARFTPVGFIEGLTVPSVMLLFFMGSAPAYASDEVIDFDAADYSVLAYRGISWVLATEGADLTAGAAGCVIDGATVHAELHLEKGWNQVAVTFERDPLTGDLVGATFGNDETEEVIFNAPVGAAR